MLSFWKQGTKRACRGNQGSKPLFPDRRATRAPICRQSVTKSPTGRRLPCMRRRAAQTPACHPSRSIGLGGGSTPGGLATWAGKEGKGNRHHHLRPNILQGQSALTLQGAETQWDGPWMQCGCEEPPPPRKSSRRCNSAGVPKPGKVLCVAQPDLARLMCFAQGEEVLLVVLRWGEAERTCSKHGNGGRQSACRMPGSGGDLLAPPSVSCLGGRKRPMIRASKTRLNNDRTAPLVAPPPFRTPRVASR